MPGKIILLPYGGLANRMRALESACALADRLDARIVVIWTEAGMECPIEHLFSPPPRVIRVWDLHRKTLLSILKRDALAAMRRAIGAHTIKEREAISLGGDLEAWRGILAKGPVFVCSCQRFSPSLQPYRDFAIAPALLAKAASIRAHWGVEIVGVHIRRTDNLWSIQQSPTSAFFREMDVEIARAPNTRFFVATDDPSEEASMVERYGDRILRTEKRSLDRKQLSAVEDAMVDFLLLAGTRKIIGSGASSFSEEAARFGGIELHRALAEPSETTG